MSRKRGNIAPQASLFPFLSILACIIGVLALMIGMLAPSQANVKSVTSNTDAAELAAKLAEQKEKLAFAETDLSRLNQRRNEAQEIHSQLERAENELKELQAHRNEREQKRKLAADEKAKVEADLKSVEAEVAQLNKVVPSLTAEVTKLQDDLAEQLKPPPDPITQVAAYRAKRNIEAVFVECRPDSIAVLDEEKPLEAKLAGLDSNAEFLKLLDEVAGNPHGAVVFLVRSNAVSTYLAARAIARQRGCRNGKLPILGQGLIDVSDAVKQPTKEE